MLSNKCKYAIRAVLFLTVKSSNENKYGIKSIADELKIPSHFLGKILQELVKKKMIISVKGPHGGFFINEEDKNIPLMNIIHAIDGDSFFTTCGLGLDNCSDERPCPIHHDFKKSRNILLNTLESKTILDISKDIETEDLFLVK